MNPGLSAAKAHLFIASIHLLLTIHPPSATSTHSSTHLSTPSPPSPYLSSTHHPSSLPLLCAPMYPSTNPPINPPIPPSSISAPTSSHSLPVHQPFHSLFHSFTHQPLTHPSPHQFTLPLPIYQPTHIPTGTPNSPPPHSSSHLHSSPHIQPCLTFCLPTTHPFIQQLLRASYGPGTVLGAENTWGDGGCVRETGGAVSL